MRRQHPKVLQEINRPVIDLEREATDRQAVRQADRQTKEQLEKMRRQTAIVMRQIACEYEIKPDIIKAVQSL